ncbi:MAG: phosphoribosylglycinamide formyltransferase [Gracilimonas sp.]|uniref:phosphoribosylglycinamide formyltransferase n=1 Tax=Gracilimonas TaxID=649462 RepID=UPI001B0C914D|nr:phosphoribosylglycinamide formyltransferase [Gracilimonas sp.]MBO6586956.1 phosphoribosylglycinamide formyltransferase [Gracilimonas sp.]MBO6614556.1 phosphoribosylglycinamide formyltransferase [Gracilimonas sp.]
MKNIVVFASGSGTNFQSIIDAIQRGELSARISGLITNKPGIGAIERAEKNDIPVKVINPEEPGSEQDYEEALLRQLEAWDADLIALAGYLKKIPSSVIKMYSNRILNIHPSLLPKFGGKGFYGSNVHKAVLEAGETESGCTVHIVTEEFDEGPILAQIKVPVHENDTPEDLAKRVLKEEHRLYPQTIQKHIQNL